MTWLDPTQNRWREQAADELDALLEHHTWILTIGYLAAVVAAAITAGAGASLLTIAAGILMFTAGVVYGHKASQT